MACGICPVQGCGRKMRKTVGGCVCPLHPENGIFPEANTEKPSVTKDMKESTKGSPPFSTQEIRRGYRRG